MKQKYSIEKSTNKRNTYEIWKYNSRRGFYNFVAYISKDEVEIFKRMHKNDIIVEK